jgi:hypothetical protein
MIVLSNNPINIVSYKNMLSVPLGFLAANPKLYANG